MCELWTQNVGLWIYIFKEFREEDFRRVKVSDEVWWIFHKLPEISAKLIVATFFALRKCQGFSTFSLLSSFERSFYKYFHKLQNGKKFRALTKIEVGKKQVFGPDCWENMSLFMSFQNYKVLTGWVLQSLRKF